MSNALITPFPDLSDHDLAAEVARINARTARNLNLVIVNYAFQQKD